MHRPKFVNYNTLWFPVQRKLFNRSASDFVREFIPSDDQIKQFRRDGFLIVKEFITKDFALKLRDRLEPLFAGQFETGIYPDEWHWRKGLSLPDVTREICNAWKCDRTIAKIVLSEQLGKISSMLGGWNGSRIAQDDIWMKPPGKGKEISYHTDTAYIPWSEVTCWIALDDVSKESGTLEYVKGSHLWKDLPAAPKEEVFSTFHAPEDHYRSGLNALAKAKNLDKKKLEELITHVEVPIGGCAFHNGDIYHGSGMNTSKNWRRSIGIHLIDEKSSFKGSNVGYIYGRYKIVGSDEMNESFFPITYRKDGYRTPFLKTYLSSN